MAHSTSENYNFEQIFIILHDKQGMHIAQAPYPLIHHWINQTVWKNVSAWLI